MQCPRCRTTNRKGYRFCAECGAPLPIVCSGCGFVNEPDGRFCGGCGAELAAPSPTAGEGGQGLDASEAERRQLTVMFCDLAGSTALSEQMDPEELRDVIRAYQEACAGVIDRFEGFIARYMGDGLLVYFGYPQAHEDDAERAVRAGLGIVGAVAGLRPRDDLILQVRVGIATGLVVVGDIVGQGSSEERVVLGETPNLAARLQGVAAPDTVVISPSTQRLVDGLFVCDDLGPQNLKGLSDPVSACRVSGESGALSRFEAAAEKGLTPLVGREEETALLLDRWQRAKEGEGHAVLISGEAGFGKSRLIRGFQDRLDDGAYRLVSLFCSPFHQNSFLHPLISQLQRSLRLASFDAPEQQLDQLDGFLAGLGLPVAQISPLLASLLMGTVPARHDPPQGSAEEIKGMTLEVLLAVIEALALERPVLMVVEDAHWIDPSTLEFLGALIERLGSLRVVLLVTFRSEFEPPWADQAAVSRISLGRLSREKSAEIVASLTGGKAVPDVALDTIMERTDGVPLFVEELTKTVLESGLLEEGEDGYILPGPLPALAIPASLQDSLMARLDRLAGVKELAQLAATIGRSFGRPLLAAVTPLDDAGLDGGLATLVEAGLIFRRGAPPDLDYEFKHALVQETAYQSLLLSTRRRTHLRIARVLEERFPQVLEFEPELIAHHYTEAGEAEPAVTHWQTAGSRAAGRWANAEAIGHLTKAMAVLGSCPDGEERARREIRLGIDLVASMRIVDRYDEALAILDRVEVMARDHGDARDLSLVHYYRGNIYFPLGNIAGCLEQHEQARRYAHDADSPEDEARALGGLGDAYYLGGRMITAHGFFHRCVELCRLNGIRAIEVANLPMRGHTGLYMNDLPGALDDCQAAAEAAAEAGNRRAEMISRGSCLGKVLFDMADLAAARREFEKALGLASGLGARRFEPMYQLYLGKLLAIEGDRSAATDVVATSRDTGIAFAGPMALGALAVVSEDADVRQDALAEADRLLASGCPSHNHIWFHRDAMEACLGAEDWTGVERYATALAEYTRVEPLPWCDLFIARARALAAFGQNGRDAATMAELQRVRDEINRIGLKVALPALDAALSR